MAIIKIGINMNEMGSQISDKGWLNLDVMVQDRTDQFGNNITVLANQTKEQRDAKEERIKAGSGKVVYTKDGVITVAAKTI